MNFLSFFQKIPSLEFILKRMEIFLIDNAIKSHRKNIAYTRSTTEILQYIKEFEKTQMKEILYEKQLKFKQFLFDQLNRYEFSFKSPFKPLPTFKIDYEKNRELQRVKE